MPAIHETAYPRLKSSLTARDLAESYTPTVEEMTLINGIVKGLQAKLCFLLLLKTFQRLGYFMQLRDVPSLITDHIAAHLNYTPPLPDLAAYDESGTRRRHVQIIRQYIGVSPFNAEGQLVLAAAFCEAAHTKEDLADIINVGIEELVRQRFELPGFTTLAEEARRERAEVNRTFYSSVSDSLGNEGRWLIDQLFIVKDSQSSPWNSLKDDPGRPTLDHLRDLVHHMNWLAAHNVETGALSKLPDVKVRHFAAEAKSLDAARMQEMEPTKRYTLAAALIKMQVAQCLDDIGEMFIKRMHKIHYRGQTALEEYRARHQTRTDQLVTILYDLLTIMQQEGAPEEKLAAMRAHLKEEPEQILESCKAYTAYSDNNYTSFLWRFYKSHRQTLFALLDHIALVSTSNDTTLENAINFLIRHRHRKGDWLPIENNTGEETTTDGGQAKSLDLSWVPDKWWKLVTGNSNKGVVPTQVDRRHFEVCVFTQVMQELKSGDLCIAGSDKFSDYRQQLISWEEYDQTVGVYGEQVGLPVDSKEFVAQTRKWLEDVAAATDSSFPENEAVRIEKGEPVLSRLERKAIPTQLKDLEHLLSSRMEPVGILDVIADTENWLGWSNVFGPLSGHDAKLEDPRGRYVTTTFCYGCNLGPTQTARSLQGIDRRQIAWVNQRHITEEKLDEVNTRVINAYNRFSLPKFWGSGKHASADGTKWDVYEQNLLSEYHIRYGGYGGIGYYHVSDTYVALFSHFIPCGVWEAVYILDGLLKNQSDIQPDTLHADTQGQSTPVFALSYLLGIDLMPRIRNWKDLKLFRPSKNARYVHIDELFSEAIDWKIIEKHLPDMLRVILSIKAGRISASTLLRKLSTYSRKNKLYVAMRELGRAVRTVFLLKYLSDAELRQVIQSATNKSEAFNGFTKWVGFGGDGIISENNRAEQRKFIKYNHLVSNCLIFHNVYSMTRAFHQLAREGYEIDEEAVARLSPYLTEHINRFGRYTLDLKRNMPSPDYNLAIKTSILQV